MFANTWYYMALSERHLREWVGLEGEILKIGPFRMGKFACPGVDLHCGARVVEKREENGKNVCELTLSGFRVAPLCHRKRAPPVSSRVV